MSSAASNEPHTLQQSRRGTASLVGQTSTQPQRAQNERSAKQTQQNGQQQNGQDQNHDQAEEKGGGRKEEGEPSTHSQRESQHQPLQPFGLEYNECSITAITRWAKNEFIPTAAATNNAAASHGATENGTSASSLAPQGDASMLPPNALSQQRLLFQTVPVLFRKCTICGDYGHYEIECAHVNDDQASELVDAVKSQGVMRELQSIFHKTDPFSITVRKKPNGHDDDDDDDDDSVANGDGEDRTGEQKNYDDHNGHDHHTGAKHPNGHIHDQHDAAAATEEAIAAAGLMTDHFCEICRSRYNGDNMLFCDGCDKLFHLYCLRPPLDSVPEGDWFCHNCADRLEDVNSDVEIEVLDGIVIEQRKRSRYKIDVEDSARDHASGDGAGDGPQAMPVAAAAAAAAAAGSQRTTHIANGWGSAFSIVQDRDEAESSASQTSSRSRKRRRNAGSRGNGNARVTQIDGITVRAQLPPPSHKYHALAAGIGNGADGNGNGHDHGHGGATNDFAGAASASSSRVDWQPQNILPHCTVVWFNLEGSDDGDADMNINADSHPPAHQPETADKAGRKMKFNGHSHGHDHGSYNSNHQHRQNRRRDRPTNSNGRSTSGTLGTVLLVDESTNMALVRRLNKWDALRSNVDRKMNVLMAANATVLGSQIPSPASIVLEVHASSTVWKPTKDLFVVAHPPTHTASEDFTEHILESMMPPPLPPQQLTSGAPTIQDNPNRATRR